MSTATDLAAAHAARIEAAARHDSASRALSRGNDAVAAAEGELKKLTDRDNAAVDRHADRVAAWVREGHCAAPPVLTVNEAHETALRTATYSVAAARKALEQLTADERAAHQALEAGQAAVEAAADAQLAAEADAVAARIDVHFAEIDRLGAELRQYQPNDLNVPLNRLAAVGRQRPTARVRRVLDRLALIEADGGQVALHTPLNHLPWSGHGIPAVSDFLAQRRAALVSGEAAAPHEPQEVAA